MAESINRTLSDGASLASFEVVFTGDAGGEADTVVDVSSLAGATGDGTDRVRVRSLKAFVCGDPATPGIATSVNLIWSGSGDTFLTLPTGITDITMSISPTSGATGDITFQSTANTPFTLHLIVDKTNGFTLSTAKLTSLSKV
ncbi:hypothetical protein CMI47_15820 [Candidatus Pacearchaeota archaeon]|nr:hypothetical protein [Candidatus Pacearchaeota archaeon]|tara:strand:+ start:1583 stop:2011 length:429 start_codon:yes stop_codon:yes gene_type:complete